VEIAEAVLALDGIVGGDEVVCWLHGANVVVLVVFGLARNASRIAGNCQGGYLNFQRPEKHFLH